MGIVAAENLLTSNLDSTAMYCDTPGLQGYRYAHAISLGCLCYPSALFKRLDLKRYSCPFDWMFSVLPMVEECIKSDFRNFLDQKYYEPVLVEGKFEFKHAFYQSYWNTNFNHYDPTSKDGYAYLTRCVNRFRKVLQSSDWKLYLFLAPIQPSETHQYVENFRSLDALLKSRSANTSLLGITTHPATAGDARLEVLDEAGTSRLLNFASRSSLAGIKYGDESDDKVIDQLVKDTMKTR